MVYIYFLGFAILRHSWYNAVCSRCFAFLSLWVRKSFSDSLDKKTKQNNPPICFNNQVDLQGESESWTSITMEEILYWLLRYHSTHYIGQRNKWSWLTTREWETRGTDSSAHDIMFWPKQHRQTQRTWFCL